LTKRVVVLRQAQTYLPAFCVHRYPASGSRDLDVCETRRTAGPYTIPGRPNVISRTQASVFIRRARRSSAVLVASEIQLLF
jgi:hypothetical protein